MKNDLILVYDDRVQVTQTLKDIVSVDNYSDITKSRKKIYEIVLEEKIVNNFKDTIHLKSDDDLKLLDSIRAINDDYFYLVFPSSIVPENYIFMQKLIEQCKYSNGSVNFISNNNSGYITLESGSSVMRHCKMRNDTKNKTVFSYEDYGASVEISSNEFYDLSDMSTFIYFMSNATGTRAFNSISIKKNYVQKKSEDSKKMFAEYNFYQLVEGKIKQYIVPTFNFNDSKTDKYTTYEMERLRIPDLSIQYVNQSLNIDIFKNLCNQFFDYINSRPTKKISKAEYVNSYENNIILKMQLRINQFLKTDLGKKINQELKNNASIDIIGLTSKTEKLIKKILSNNILKYHTISHGDSCFSNILYDKRISLFRLIDPKGASNKDELYLNPLYDIAKFSHSILGDYDLINHGLFDCKFDNDLNFILSFDHISSAYKMKQEFINQLDNNQFSLESVRAIELSLFISMVPFHSDNPKKILGFLLNARNLLNELSSKY